MLTGQSYHSSSESTTAAAAADATAVTNTIISQLSLVSRRTGRTLKPSDVTETLNRAAAILTHMETDTTHDTTVPPVSSKQTIPVMTMDHSDIMSHVWNNNNNNNNNTSSSSLPSSLNVSHVNGSSNAGSSGGGTNSHYQQVSTISGSSSNNSGIDIYTCQEDQAATTTSSLTPGPKVVLTPVPHSHSFDERIVDCSSQIKIGRAVARNKPATNNAIFDCKVLSRNHALIWYQSGKFYIQDTKSSNGTFVNQQRLSVANEESGPTTINSGDVVQFGVDVVENQKRVTHGCVVATIRLFLPGGDELPPPDPSDQSIISPSESVTGSIQQQQQQQQIDKHSAPQVVTTAQLIQLTNCLKDALNREDFLNSKIQLLEKSLCQAIEKADAGWQSVMHEDALLSKIESLQIKLQTVLKALAAKSTDEEILNLRNEIQRLHDEREKYESSAKESIRKEMDKVVESHGRISELNLQLNSAASEIELMKKMAIKMEQELDKISEAYDSCKEELAEFKKRHANCEEEDKLTCKNDMQELLETKSRLEETEQLVNRLQAQILELQQREETILFHVPVHESHSDEVPLADEAAEQQSTTKVSEPQDLINSSSDQLLTQAIESAEEAEVVMAETPADVGLEEAGDQVAEIARLNQCIDDLMNQLNSITEEYDRKVDECQQMVKVHESCATVIESLRQQLQQLAEVKETATIGSNSVVVEDQPAAFSFNENQSSPKISPIPLSVMSPYTEITDRPDDVIDSESHPSTSHQVSVKNCSEVHSILTILISFQVT